MLLIFILLNIFNLATGTVKFPTEQYSHTMELGNVDGQFVVFWKTTGLQPTNSITFEVYGRTKGWVGLGISPNGGMADADIVVGGVLDGNGYLQDRYASGFSTPIVDDTQNCQLIMASENTTHTMIKFTRKLFTCDPNDRSITNDTMKLIWAMGKEDAGGSVFKIHAHTDRGARTTHLLSPQETKRLPLPADVVNLDFIMENVQIPSTERSLYMCKILKLPNLKKHHIIRYHPIMQSGNEPYLHHMLVYHCLGDMSHLLNKQQLCFTGNNGSISEMYACNIRYIAVWGIGGEGLSYPTELGYPIFDTGESPFVMLEIHYDNPGLVKTKPDNSGMRIYITPTLRPVEIGSILVGITVAKNYLIIPPKQKTVTVYSICSWRCTQDLPEDGLNVITGLLHAHILSKAVRLRHFRNNVELEPMFEDSTYDFNYQDIGYHKVPVKLYPNDTLVTECEYTSMDLEQATYGGFNTTEEMCLVFIDYYPRIKNMFSCHSAFQRNPAATVLELEPIMGSSSRDPLYKTKDNKVVNIVQAVDAFDWGIADSGNQSESMQKLQTEVDNGIYMEFCSRRNENLLGASEDEYMNETGSKIEYFFNVTLPKVPKFHYFNPCDQNSVNDLAAIEPQRDDGAGNGASWCTGQVWCALLIVLTLICNVVM